ncbi:MAG: cobyrinate a,c-diamide synthase [Peptococcaceae bacterium]|nr:cobyrinate a,c-diamide synthase [Peptococcaceae bacterium]
MKAKIPRFMFAAFHSGSGKTTITCAVLKALLEDGVTPAAFKCGPDYIDPMFHSEVIGVKSRNLDLFMLSEDVCKYLLVNNSKGSQIAVLEGVMGYYDGIGAVSTAASSYHLASVTKTPVILIVDCKGSSLSLAALIKGFARFKPDSGIKGIILNHLSASMYPTYKEMIEAETGIAVMGYFPETKGASLESRHLGLITASEVSDLQNKMTLLAAEARKSIDLNALLKIAESAGEIDYQEFPIAKSFDVSVAVARDKAFCFYYQDSLDLLESMGAKIRYFSPLQDGALPECHGLILGGGYPEIYAKELSANTQMLSGIKNAVENNLPCIAECGGFMVLLRSITDKEGHQYEMAGCIDGEAFMTDKLNRFGYITLHAQEDNLLCRAGEKINAHEFHYSNSTANGSAFKAVKPTSGRQWECVNAGVNLFAGYPHLHLWGNVNFAYAFLDKCQQYKKSHG